MDDSPVVFGVLGPLRMWVHGREVAMSRPVIRRLLGALLLTPGRLVDRSRLVEFVWGPSGCDPATLYSAVYRLKVWLRTHAGPVQEGLPAVVRIGEDYRFDVQEDRVDVGRFRAALGRARGEPDAQRRIDALLSALGMWRGPVL